MWILIHHLHIWSTCPVLTKSLHALIIHTSVQLSSVAQSCLNLCDPMGCSTPGFPVHHQLLELSQTHVHRVSDATQPSVIPFSFCLQSFPASRSFPLSQFFASGGQNIGVSASASTFIATPGTVLGPGELEIRHSSSEWRQHNSAARREMYHFLNTLRHSLNSFFLRAMAVMTLKNLTEGGALSSRCLLVPLFLLLSLGDHLLF